MCKVRGQNEHLNFNQNTARLTCNLSRACFFINRAKNILSPKALKTLYTSFFHTHPLYCTNIYAHTSETNTTAIFRQQKKAIRILAKADCLEHTAPLFKSLSILSLEKIILQARVTFMHSIYYNYAPPSFNNTWATYAKRNIDNNICNDSYFHLAFPRIKLFKKLPIYSMAAAWNNLGDLRFQYNKTTFKFSLLDFLHTPNHDEEG